jgi:hypothetical protein
MCRDDVWVFRQSQGQLFKTRRNYVTFFIDGLCSPTAIREPAWKRSTRTCMLHLILHAVSRR